jgi:prolyl-tRNA synthetase
MTQEEVMTAIARSELRSYKQLPQIWYQIQTKFRDEPRPKSGLLRVRQFLMKDSYSFDIDEAGLDASYAKHEAVYRRIFTRCGLEFLVVEADSGSMGGTGSQEFMVSTDAGEDLIASSSSGYAANVEKATSKLAPVTDLAPTGDGTPELVHTPGQRTIDEVSAYLGVERTHQMKTMALVATIHGGKDVTELPIVVLLRGDHELNEAKLALTMPSFLATPKSPLDVKDLRELRMMTPEEILLVFGGPAGYLGPVGIDSEFDVNSFWTASKHFPPQPKKAIIILDAALEHRTNLIAGANKEEYHLRNVTPGRDFTPTITADVRSVNEGELDPIGGEPLHIAKAVEIGHIFKLGYKYSKSMGASVLNRDGKETTPIMGSYGIGIERILTAAIEQSAAKFAAQSANDPKASDAYALPPSIAPFQVVVTITNVREAELLAAGEKIAADLSAAGIDVLLDDRDERAGVKFKDAELIGVPFRIAVGKKLVEGKVELLNRLTNRTDDIPVGEAVQQMQAALSGSSLEPRT